MIILERNWYILISAIFFIINAHASSVGRRGIKFWSSFFQLVNMYLNDFLIKNLIISSFAFFTFVNFYANIWIPQIKTETRILQKIALLYQFYPHLYLLLQPRMQPCCYIEIILLFRYFFLFLFKKLCLFCLFILTLLYLFRFFLD